MHMATNKKHTQGEASPSPYCSFCNYSCNTNKWKWLTGCQEYFVLTTESTLLTKFPQLSLWVAEFQPPDNTISHSFLTNYPIYTKYLPNPRKKTPILLQILITCKLKWPSLQYHFCIEDPISGGGIWTSHMCNKLICISKYVYNLMHTIHGYKQMWICKWMFIVVPNVEKLVATSYCFSIYRKSIRDSKLTQSFW